MEVVATAGNIELAVSGGAAGAAGCGCDYPAYVSRGVVDVMPANVEEADAEVYPSLYRGSGSEIEGYTVQQKARTLDYFFHNGWPNGNLYFERRTWPGWNKEDRALPNFATYRARALERRKYDEGHTHARTHKLA